MYVIGTAGHVDHGKSALVHALTGMDPDRLREEKERGMTIDLGFAWLKLPSGQEVSIVDVPGHERFIKNMLAGVGGIDLALLMVAADEGVMPQTREHLAILDLLQIKQGLAVITKKDLVDDGWLELVVADVQQVLQGTVLAQAPVVVTSALTKEGLPQLLTTLDALLDTTPLKTDLGRPRLPIDRIFTISGFGTVVTGTLIDGHLVIGQEVEIVPAGLKSRVRGLQTHRQKVEQAQPGSRVAANLAGLAVEQLKRGDVVTNPGWLRPTQAVDVRLRTVRDLLHPLRHNASVAFHTGSSEVSAKVRLLEKEELGPGEISWAQLRLEQPVAVVAGDYFILRSPQETLGGGRIVEAQAKRHRRYHPATLEALSVLEKGTPEEILLKALELVEPLEQKGVLSKSPLPPDVARQALKSLISQGQVVVLDNTHNPDSPVMTLAGWARLRDKLTQTLEDFHRQSPLRSGMGKEELKSRLGVTTRVFQATLQRLEAEGQIVQDEIQVRLSSHRIRLTPQQQAQVGAFIEELKSNPYAPQPTTTLSPELLKLLVEQGHVVRLTEDIILDASAYGDMVQRVVDTLKAKGKLTVAEVRDLFQTSRKYAVALMEHLDERRITRRVGDERVLR